MTIRLTSTQHNYLEVLAVKRRDGANEWCLPGAFVGPRLDIEPDETDDLFKKLCKKSTPSPQAVPRQGPREDGPSDLLDSQHDSLVRKRYNILRAMRDDMKLKMDLLPGDIQILNNRTTMHAREEFHDYDEVERKRLLLRIWLNTPEGRPVAPEMLNQLNTGPRGGVRAQ